MAISKTQCGWMALGGMLCLFGVVLTCQWKESNRALAQTDDNVVIPVGAPVPVSEKLPPPEAGPELKPPMKEVAESSPPPEPLPLTEPILPLPLPDPEPRTVVDPAVKPVSGTMPKSAGTDAKSPAPPLPPPTPIAPSLTPPASTLPPLKVEPMSKADSALSDPPPAPPTPAPNVPQPVLPGTPGVPTTRTTPSLPTAAVSQAEYRTEGEPPLAPRPGPIQVYHVKHDGESPREIARRTLGTSERWEDVIKLNPNLKPDATLTEGTMVRLPADACIPVDEVETVRPLPVLRKPTPTKARVLPLTGTFPCNLDEKHTLVLPRAIRDQLGNCDTVLVSPGPDHCLWVTNHAHLERLADRLEQSPAREAEVRVFRRLYYAQTEKVPLTSDGRAQIPEKLVQFAGLHQEVVLVGIDDHFELWDVARWKQYTQQQSNAARAVAVEE